MTIDLKTALLFVGIPIVLTFLGELAGRLGFVRTSHALLSLGPDVRRLVAGPPVEPQREAQGEERKP